MFLEINKLNITRKGKLLFKDFSIKLEEGSVTGFYLPTGSGKSTLFDILNFGIENIDGAENVSGNIITEKGIIFGRVFQSPRLFENLSVLKNLLIPLHNFYDKKTSKEIAFKYLQLLNLDSKTNLMACELSGGEKQRLCIARVLSFPCNCLLLDEPLSHQDFENKELIINLLKEEINKKKITTLIVSHDSEELNGLCQNVVNNFIINYN